MDLVKSTFQVVSDNGDVIAFNDLESYLTIYEDRDSVPSSDLAAFAIEHKNVRYENGAIESGVVVTHYNNDELNEMLAAHRAEQAEWAAHTRSESQPSIFI